MMKKMIMMKTMKMMKILKTPQSTQEATLETPHPQKTLESTLETPLPQSTHVRTQCNLRTKKKTQNLRYNN